MFASLRRSPYAVTGSKLPTAVGTTPAPSIKGVFLANTRSISVFHIHWQSWFWVFVEGIQLFVIKGYLYPETLPVLVKYVGTMDLHITSGGSLSHGSLGP